MTLPTTTRHPVNAATATDVAGIDPSGWTWCRACLLVPVTAPGTACCGWCDNTTPDADTAPRCVSCGGPGPR